MSQGLFIQKLHKLNILLHILKALIAWSCDKAYAWIAVSVTTLELSQGWSLVQEAGYPQRKGVKQDFGSHSFIRSGETASLFPFQMKNSFYWNILSQTARQDILFLHTNINKHEKQTTGNSVLPWRPSKEKDFNWWIFITFQVFHFPV